MGNELARADSVSDRAAPEGVVDTVGELQGIPGEEGTIRRKLELLCRITRSFAETGVEVEPALESVVADVGQTLGVVAVLCVRDADGRLRPAAAHHPSPEGRVSLAAVADTVQRWLGAEVIAANAPSHHGVVVPVLDPEELVERALPEDRSLLERHPVYALIHAPLRSHEGALSGTLTLARTRRAETFSTEDLVLAEEIAARTAALLEGVRLFRENALSRARAELLYRFAHVVVDASRIEEVFESALDTLEHGIGAGRASIESVDPEGGLRFRASRGLSAEYERTLGAALPWPYDERAPEPVLVDVCAKSSVFAAYRDAFEREHVHTVACIPLVSRGRLLGSLALYHDGEHRFGKDDIELAFSLANHLAAVAERFAATSRERERVRVARLAAAVGQAFTRKAPLSEKLSAIATAVVHDLEVACARVWLYDENARVLRLQASAGLSPRLDDAHDELPLGATEMGRVAASRRPHVTNSVPTDPELTDAEWARREGIVAFAGLPLVVEDRLIGAIAFFARSPFSETLTSMLQSVADEIALGVDRECAEGERERLFEELSRNLHFSEMFVGVLGHDLRNPLAAITTASELILRRENDERVVRLVERVRASAERMARMIDQILDFTRARLGGGIPIEPTGVNLLDLAKGLVDELEGVVPRRIVLESTGDPQGRWDSDRLSQVISNLLTNATEHGPPDQPVRLTIDGRQPARVTLEVWNAGAIVPEVLSTLFDPFRRARGRTRGRARGLGLGLYIVEQVIAAHGGRIDVRSSEGEGTTFSVSIPREPPVASAESSSRRREPGRNQSTYDSLASRS